MNVNCTLFNRSEKEKEEEREPELQGKVIKQYICQFKLELVQDTKAEGC